jgi:hypothetical protein
MDNIQQQSNEERRHMEESPWTDMSADEIAQFLYEQPTYCMTPRQASEWDAGVDAGIQKARDNLHTTGNIHGTPAYARRFIGYGDDRQPIYEHVRVI